MWISQWGDVMGKAKHISLCGVLIALALALSYTERFIPLQFLIPLPGAKLGLANIVTLIALYTLRRRYAIAILLCRCFLGAVFGGGFTGLVFSCCGGLLALGAMLLAQQSGFFSVYGVSILGAAAHSIGQILAAMVLMRSYYIVAYLPYLLLAAIATGLLTGSLCVSVLRILPKARIRLSQPLHQEEIS